MRKLLLVAALMFAGCDDVVVPDGGVDAGGDTDAGPVDAGPPPDAGPYCPTGYAFVPFLTSTATTHTFASADQVLDTGTSYAAVLETDQGRIVFDLYASQTPITSNSFVFLALHHFFDGIAFHRVIDNFVVQGGDPNTLSTNMSTWGGGGPGYFCGLEVTPSLTYDGAGVVGMANSSPNTNGSQFFITLSAQHGLDQHYTIFAKVIEGAEVLPMIVRGMPPANPTRMTQVYICSH